MLRNLNFKAVNINGQLSQPQRLAAMNKFKTGERSILIATDVASRGLDIPAVDLVINFDIPSNPKDYIHRVGRTARAGKSGRAITIVTQYDVENCQKIEHVIGKQLVEYDINDKQALILSDSVTEATRLANLVSTISSSHPSDPSLSVRRTSARTSHRKASRSEQTMTTIQRATRTWLCSTRSVRAARWPRRAWAAAVLPRKDRGSFDLNILR